MTIGEAIALLEAMPKHAPLMIYNDRDNEMEDVQQFHLLRDGPSFLYVWARGGCHRLPGEEVDPKTVEGP